MSVNFEHYRTINTVIILGVLLMAIPYKTRQPVYLTDPSGRLTNMEGIGPSAATDSYNLAVKASINFPFTPTISVIQSAGYSSYDLTHTNYQQRAFDSSTNVELNITAPMIVRNAEEAEYVYHAAMFMRAAMKMSFGQDETPGMPPPVLRLYAHGIYHNLPVQIRDFTWNLDSDIDYIETEIRSGLEKQMFSNYKDFGERTEGANGKITVRVPVMNMFVFSLQSTFSPQSVRENFGVQDYLDGKIRNKGYV